jgi:opacity protein-like surface antigen
MKKTIVLAAVAASIAGGAYAGADEPVAVVEAIVEAEPASQATDWSGFYAGGLYGTNSGEQTYSSGPAYPDMTGTTYGGFAGYNVQNGSMVYGGEIAYSVGEVFLGDAIFPDYFHDSFTDAKARIGYATGPTLIYAVAGGSFGTWADGPYGTISSGFNYGAGVDVLVTDQIFVGGEFLIRDLTSEDGVEDQVGLTFDTTVQSVQIRVGMKF